MANLRAVSVLCAARNSVYHSLPGVEVYDAGRDARTFPGDTPIIAHPPCRAWSLKLRHMAIRLESEMSLGIWCAEQLRRCGGVLEQPAKSALFGAAKLPAVNESDGRLWTINVQQSWWGYPLAKPTWLCFCGIDPAAVNVPLRLHCRNADRRRFRLMSHNQRASTCEAFAVWLVDVARTSTLTEPQKT